MLSHRLGKAEKLKPTQNQQVSRNHYRGRGDDYSHHSWSKKPLVQRGWLCIWHCGRDALVKQDCNLDLPFNSMSNNSLSFCLDSPWVSSFYLLVMYLLISLPGFSLENNWAHRFPGETLLIWLKIPKQIGQTLPALVMGFGWISHTYK